MCEWYSQICQNIILLNLIPTNLHTYLDYYRMNEHYRYAFWVAAHIIILVLVYLNELICDHAFRLHRPKSSKRIMQIESNYYHHPIKNRRLAYIINLTVALIIIFRSRIEKPYGMLFCLGYWSFMSSSNVDRIVNFYTFQWFIVILHPNNKRNWFKRGMWLTFLRE